MLLYENPKKIEIRNRYSLFVDGKEIEPQVRTYKEIKEVLYKDYTPSSEEEFKMYYMFRKIYKKDEIRFDITIIPNRILNGEYNKTYGHYHPKAPSGIPYPELYQVLRGKGAFLLQKENKDGTVSVLLVVGKEGEIIIVPPGYGHVSINIGEVPLVLSNLVYDNFTPEYEKFKKNKGAAYYYTTSGLVHNTRYMVAFIDRTTPLSLLKHYGLTFRDLLIDFAENPKIFEFLKKPELLKK